MTLPAIGFSGKAGVKFPFFLGFRHVVRKFRIYCNRYVL